MKIKNIIMISFFITAIILASAGTYFSNTADIDFVEKEIVNHIQSTAESRASHIKTYFDQNIERLVLITTKTQLRIELETYNENKNQESLDKITKIIEDAKIPIEDFELICVVGLDGKIITSTNPSFIGRDVSDEHFFNRAKENNSIHFIEENGEMMLFVSGPFINKGKLIGVGITVVSIDKLDKIVRDRTGLGETGEVLVAIQSDEKRIYLFDRLFESKAVAQDIESELTAEPMKQALLGNNLFFEDSLDYRNKPVLAVSKFVSLDSSDGEGLGIVVKIDKEETFGVVEERFWKTSLILIISIVILTSIVGFFIARLISTPIKKLNENVNAVTKGNLDIQLPPSRITEINNLTESLNRVLASMKLAILRMGVTKGQLGLGEAIKEKEEAEDKFELIFNKSPIMMSLTDLSTGRFIDVNETYIKLTGYTREELIGKTSIEVGLYYNPKDRDKIKKLMNKEGSVRDFKLKIKNKQKQVLTVLFSADLIELEGKKYLLATAKDITHEKQIDKKLQNVLDNMYDIIYEYDSKGELTFIGGNLQKYGYTQDDLQGQNIADFICEEDKERVMRDVQKTLKTGQEFPTRFKLRCKDGTCVPVEEIGKVKKDVKGNIFGMVGTIRDLSDERKITDITNAILVCLNRAGNVQVINQMGAEILGYKDESEIVGKNWFDNFVPEKVREDVRALANKMIAGKVVVNKYNENPVLTKSGKELNIAWHGEVIKNNQGDIVGHLAVGKVLEDKVDDNVKEKKENDDKAKAKDNVVKRLVNGAKEGFAPKKVPVANKFVPKQSNALPEKTVVKKQENKLPPKPKSPKFISKPVPVKKSVKQGDAFTKKSVKNKVKKEKKKTNLKSNNDDREKKYSLNK